MSHFDDAVERSSKEHRRYGDGAAKALLRKVRELPGISAFELGEGKQVSNQISWLEIYGLIIYHSGGWWAAKEEDESTAVRKARS